MQMAAHAQPTAVAGERAEDQGCQCERRCGGEGRVAGGQDLEVARAPAAVADLELATAAGGPWRLKLAGHLLDTPLSRAQLPASAACRRWPARAGRGGLARIGHGERAGWRWSSRAVASAPSSLPWPLPPLPSGRP